ncbi:MAG: endonuclease [Clostridia bacterium]|nr:endonuclease [Clostridia bacterium]
MKLKRTASFFVALVLVILPLLTFNVTAASDQPASYSTTANSGERDVVCTTLSGTTASSYYTGSYAYDAMSGLSQSDLLTTLRTLMKSTHKKQTSYSNCRDYANKTDCENGDGYTIVTLYTSYESNYGEYNGGSGWNREHVWPKSLGGFEQEGAGADLHHIRPSESQTNSQRGNLKYGNVNGGSSTTGNMSGLAGGNYSGSYFEPLDNVKGDVARICLYVYVRWGGEYSKCSSITNVFQSVDVLLEWCALDPVDTWEMGRNEVVSKIQGNRNVFIDYPELAWQLFGRQAPTDMVTPSGEAADGTTPPVGSDTTKPVNPPVTPDEPEWFTVETPEVGTAYKFSYVHTGEDQRYFFNGQMSGSYYGDMDSSESAAVDVYIEQGNGGYYIYFYNEVNVKTYIEAFMSGTYCNLRLTQTKPSTVFVNHETYKVPTITLNGTTYFLGTFGDKTDLRPSQEKYITQGNYIGVFVTDEKPDDTTIPDGTTVKPDDTTVPDGTTVKPEDSTTPGCPHTETEISKKKDPTCGKDGYTGDVYCRACEALVEAGRVIPATGEHSFGEWKTVISAGPGTVGSKKRECEICHEEETATIPAMPAPMGTLPDGGTETQPSTDAPSDDGNSGGGCGGFTVASSLIALICAAGAAIVIKRK